MLHARKPSAVRRGWLLSAAASAIVVAAAGATPAFAQSQADDDVEEVCAKMADRQIRRLPVLDANHNLVGIISLGDLAVEGAEDVAAEALEQISQPGVH